MEWTVNELAERAGVSGRTLRHYHRIGLLLPDRVGSNGYRYYGPAAVEHTLNMRSEGREPQMDVMLQGFNDAYESEVVDRWGREAFDASNRWWHGKSVRQQQEWKARTDALLARWRALQEEGRTPDSSDAREHAAAHVNRFAEIPGTPTHSGDAENSAAMVLGMADMYAENPDFHLIFGSEAAASFAAEALRLHVQKYF